MSKVALATGGCLAFKLNNGKSISLQDNGEGRRNVLQVSEEDVTSPYGRFFAEPSKKHEGYVHIRCGYNNKYWMAREVDDHWCILADANEPQEDLSDPSCTLFRLESDGDDNSDQFKLHHDTLKRSAFLLGDSHPSKKKLRVGCLLLESMDTKQAEGGASLLSVTKQDVQAVLPKRVCFKGDNGKYLALKIINGNRFLQFSANDIGESAVRQTTSTGTDGTVRVLCDQNGLFWRRSPNWIWADSKDTTSNNKDTLFRAVSLGDDMVALQNLGNNRYCTRLTADNNESCLNANSTTINQWARLKVEEAVLSRKIYDIDYQLADARIYDNQTVSLSSAQAVNRGSMANTLTLTLKYTVVRETSLESTSSLKFGVSTTVETGVPMVVDVSMTMELETTQSYSWGKSESRSEEHSVEYGITVPPGTALTLRVLAARAACDVPFSYTQEDVLVTGETVVDRFDDGIFRGVNSYNFKYEVSEEKL